MAKKSPKWRIGVTFSQYFIVEVKADSHEEATALALESLEDDQAWDENLQGYSKIITSVFLNDREARDFSHFVADGMDAKVKVDE